MPAERFIVFCQNAKNCLFFITQLFEKENLSFGKFFFFFYRQEMNRIEKMSR